MVDEQNFSEFWWFFWDNICWNFSKFNNNSEKVKWSEIKMDNRGIENNIVAGMCVRMRRATIIVLREIIKLFHFFYDVVWPDFLIDFHGNTCILIGNIFSISRTAFFNIQISGKWTVQTSWRGNAKRLNSISCTNNTHSHILAVAFNFQPIIFRIVFHYFRS